MSVLLCLLLWSLVEVHSQTEFPYVSFMGETLANHSYVNLYLVGTDRSTGSTSNTVKCHTDLQSCCTAFEGGHRADWYFPNGDRLPFSTPTVGIHEIREDERVDLRRKNNDNSPSGIYRCDIPTIAVNDENDISVRDTVYIGVYANGGTRCDDLYINQSTC